jgi:hypothetical protein
LTTTLLSTSAAPCFDFGAPGFWELVSAVRMSVLDAAAERSVPLLVMTFVYVDPHDLATFEQFDAIVQRHGGQLLPVFLQCLTAEIVRRVASADRVARKKMLRSRAFATTWPDTKSVRFREPRTGQPAGSFGSAFSEPNSGRALKLYREGLCVIRKIVPLASSLTSRAPSRVTAMPAGRPHTVFSSSTNPVIKSS